MDVIGPSEASVIDLPPEIREEIERAQAGLRRYQDAADPRGLEEMAGALSNVAAHPQFSSLPIDFQQSVLGDCGGVLLRQARESQNLHHVDLAVGLLARHVQVSTRESPPDPYRLFELGFALLWRYSVRNDNKDLQAAIQLLADVVSSSTLPFEELALCFRHLGSALLYRYQSLGNVSDLDEALNYLDQGLRLNPVESAKSGILDVTGLVLSERFKRNGLIGDVDRAIAAFEESLRISPGGGAENNLGLALLDHYRATGEPADLEKAIHHLRSWVQHAPPGSTQLASGLNNLGLAYRLRHHDGVGQLGTLEEAIDSFRQAVDLMPAEARDFPRFLHNLGLALSDSYDEVPEESRLEEALGHLRRSLELTPAASPDRPEFLNSLGLSLSKLFDLSKNVILIDEAIGCLEQAVRLSSPGDVDRSTFWSQLGIAHRKKYQHNHTPQDLNEAVTALRESVLAATSNPVGRASALNDLGAVLLDRYEDKDNLPDLNEAVKCFNEAVELAPPQWHRRSDLLANLSRALREHSLRTGDETEIRQSVAGLREALNLTPERSSARGDLLNGLSLSLHAWYDRTGNLDDLNEAIQCVRQSILSAVPQPVYMTNLGSLLQDRYLRTQKPEDLSEAVTLLQQSVDLTPSESPDLPVRLSNLARGLHERYRAKGNLPDLVQATDHLRRSLQLAPDELSERPIFLIGLGGILRELYVHTGESRDIDEAVQCFDTALRSTNLPGLQVRAADGLALCLRDRFARTAIPADRERARESFRMCCDRAMDLNTKLSLLASLDWGMWALDLKSWGDAGVAFEYGLKAIDRLYQRQLVRGAKEVWLQTAQKLPTAAAYAFARDQKLAAAVMALEAGRARLLADAAERDSEKLEQLPALGHAELYQRFRMAADRLRRLEGAELAAIPAGKLHESAADLRPVAAAVDAAMREIQQIPGYEGFGLVPELQQIQDTLTKPLPGHAQPMLATYLIVVKGGSLALIVEPDGFQTCWLDFNNDDLAKLLLGGEGSDAAGGYLAAQLGGPSLKAVLETVLQRLGDRIVRPLAALLEETFDKLRVPVDARTVVLIPTGLLALLPLHAATYQTGGDTVTKSLIDHFTVAYTPSARTLAHSRNRTGPVVDAVKTLFAVGNPLPLPAGTAPLMFARSEVQEIASLFGRNAVAYSERDCGLGAVRQGMKGASYLHFACHGRFNPENPMDSGLILSNGDCLTLADLLFSDRLANARLAILSACQTAMIDFSRLPEEAVGLPAGFLQAGARGVIGSLWPVNDLSTALLMMRFYEGHLGIRTGARPALHPADALREAQLWLRSATNAELSDLFEAHKKSAPDRPTERLPYALAREKFHEFTLRNPDERPFSHPFYWAAFVFQGV